MVENPSRSAPSGLRDSYEDHPARPLPLYVTVSVPRDIADDWLNVLEDDHEDLSEEVAHDPNDFSDPTTRRAYGIDTLRQALGMPKLYEAMYAGVPRARK